MARSKRQRKINVPVVITPKAGGFRACVRMRPLNVGPSLPKHLIGRGDAVCRTGVSVRQAVQRALGAQSELLGRQHRKGHKRFGRR